jgi:hypothetical protein
VPGASRWRRWRHRRKRKVSLSQRAGSWRQPAEQQLAPRLKHSLFDVAANLPELLLVDNCPYIGRFVERIANLEFRGLGSQRREEIVEDVGMQKEARTGSARLALTREAHRRNDAVDHPIFVGVGVDDGGAFSPKLQ